MRAWGLLLVSGSLVWAATAAAWQSPQQDTAKDDAALQRTRKTVRMLDDIYKGGIVAITQNYVNDRQTAPAGKVFKEVFASAEKNGWHRVRLLDATGEPLNDENSPADDFEREAIKQLKQGKPWYEQIVQRDGKRVLLAATPVPVVFAKCTMCHENYSDVPKGQAIGALSYTIAIE